MGINLQATRIANQCPLGEKAETFDHWSFGGSEYEMGLYNSVSMYGVLHARNGNSSFYWVERGGCETDG